MKKTFSAAMLLLAFINIFAICATASSFSVGLEEVIPPAPKSVSAVSSAKGVSISWEQVENTAGYKVYRSEATGEAVEIADVRGTQSISCLDKSASSGNTYIYTVRAYNAFNEGNLSEGSEVLYLKQPTLRKVYCGFKGVELTWYKSPGAEGYTVYRKNNNKNIAIGELKGDGTCTFTDKNVKDGKKYTYTVVAHKGIYTSSFAYKSSKVFVTAPVLSKATVGNGFVTVSWKKTETAEKYRVYRKLEGESSYKRIAIVKSSVNSFKDKNVENGKSYAYTVCAVDNGVVSGFNRAGVNAKYVAVPKNVSLKNYFENTIRVKWSKVADATAYRVFRKDNVNTKWVKLTETAKLQYIDDAVVNGRVYTYAVRAVGENGGVSAYIKNVKLTSLKEPTAVKLTCTTSGVRLSWSKMTSGTGYRVYRKATGESDWSLIAKINKNTTTSYTDKNVELGESYTYTVRQVKGSKLGCYSREGFEVRYIAAPKVKAEHSPKGIVLSWNKAVTGTGYKIQRKAEGQKSWKTIGTLTRLSDTTFTDSKAVSGKKNYYRVEVRDTNLVSANVSLYGIDINKKLVALTYDDGPYTPVTNQILDVLEKHNSRATFFVVGSRVSTYKDCIKREASIGCEIGNHSYNHTILTSASPSVIKSEISKTNNAVKAITGKAPTIVRAPGGAVNSTVKANVKYPMFNWSVDTLDWESRSSSSVVASIKSSVRDGSIVLMHDLYGSTGDATEIIVPWLIKNGYQLVTVSELMAVKGIDVQKGVLYTRAY